MWVSGTECWTRNRVLEPGSNLSWAVEAPGVVALLIHSENNLYILKCPIRVTASHKWFHGTQRNDTLITRCPQTMDVLSSKKVSFLQLSCLFHSIAWESRQPGLPPETLPPVSTVSSTSISYYKMQMFKRRGQNSSTLLLVMHAQYLPSL